MQRRIRLSLRQSAFVFSSGLLLAGLVALQSLPPVHSVTRQEPASQTLPGAPPSPTPVVRPPDAPAPPALKRRDLSRYEKAGPFAIADGMERSAREAAMAPARTFLLQSWRGRRLGRLVINSLDVDGRISSSAFYVEPDEGGQWVVVLERAGGSETFRFVEEVEAPEDEPPVLDKSGEARASSGRTGLHLKQSESANSGLVL